MTSALLSPLLLECTWTRSFARSSDGHGNFRFKGVIAGVAPGGEDYLTLSQPIQFPSPGQRGRSLFSGDGSGEFVFSEALPIQTGTWTHFAARRQSGQTTLFMNGKRVASGQFSGDLDSTSSLKFGHRGNPSDTPGSVDVREFFLNGGIDEVELFVGRALSDAEIQSIFNAGTARKCKGVPFKAFSADTKIRLEPQPNQQTFKLISKFLAGSESDGIDPLNEAVSFKVGTFSATIPAGSFRPDGDGISGLKGQLRALPWR
jgi:Concanavalin A-like lectin/glucanases superfamily